MQLAQTLATRHAKSIALTQQAREGISDLQFIGACRVPHPYGPYLRQHIAVGAFVQSADGVTVTDLDGQVFYDLTGSYGVNVFGHDFYKACIAEGSARVADRGPCWAATTRLWPGMFSSCNAFPGWTKSALT